MSGRVRIIVDPPLAEDAGIRAQRARVLMPDGTEVPHVQVIEIEPIDARDLTLVRAKLTLIGVDLDIAAEWPDAHSPT